MNRYGFLCACLWAFPNVAIADWSVFAPITDAKPPTVDKMEWSGPIDAFIYSRLVDAGLEPASVTNRLAWIRRVSYDLIGLPPTPSEAQEFLEDERPDLDAMRDVVNRLLDSPRYGERWGRHWLDIVRYADSDGFAIDEERLTLWRYRDYVIRAFNDDRPFDEFLREQIAGDELEAGADGKIAISFLRLGPYEADNMTAERRRQDYLDEITTTVGSAFLGLSVGCARCHDHKFDPIPQSDFYQLQAFFTPLERKTIPVAFRPGELNSDVQRRHEQAIGRRANRLQDLEALRSDLRRKIAVAKGSIPEKVLDEELSKAIKEKQPPITDQDATKFEALKKQTDDRKPEQRFDAKVVAVSNPTSANNPPDTFVLEGGDVFARGQKVAPGFLSSVPVWSEQLRDDARASALSVGGRRALLAAWLTNLNNPITSRVLVNRIWQYHFGAGIVTTPNNFGKNGSAPSHPELLDYLARKFMAGGWRMKSLHRELVLSRTYRSSTRHAHADACSQIDPDNRLLWRSNFRRLESETIRDAVLSVSGRIRFEAGGPGFYEELPNGMARKYSFFSWDPSGEDQRRRRSVFMFQRRNLVHPMMETFDGPDINQTCAQRRNSVTAPQALSLLNGRFTNENAGHLARRLRQYATKDHEQVKRLFWLAYSREPLKQETETCVSYLRDNRKRLSKFNVDSPAGRANDRHMALRDLCLAIFNTSEFLYLD